MWKKDHNINCHGYALHRAGERKEQRLVSHLTLKQLFKNFQLVPSARDATLVAVIIPNWTQGNVVDVDVVHTVFCDAHGNLMNRIGSGGRVERTSVRKLREEYDSNWYGIVFLRSKKR